MRKHPVIVSLVLWFLLLAGFAAGYSYLSTLGDPIYLVLFGGLNLAVVVSIIAARAKRRHHFGAIKNLELKIREANLLSKRLRNSEDIALSYLPVGMILYDETQTIVWANAAAKEYFSNILVERKLAFVHEGLNAMVQKREGKFLLDVYGKRFEFVHYPKNFCLYMFEVTEREEIRQRLRDNTDAVGIINLDNLDEATAHLDLQVKTNLQGKYLGAIDNWCRKYDAYFLNLRPEKSILFVNRRQLEAMIKDEFSILDAVSDLSNQNEVRVTMSVGVACSDLPRNQLGELAEEALKLALGRGGDQVVVNIQNQPVKFFGGRSNTVEKRTKITAKINSRAIAELIDKNERTYIIPHKSTDIDAFGASIGMLRMALAQNKYARIVLDFDAIDQTCAKVINMLNREYVKLLDSIIDVRDALEEVNQNSLLIVVDHHSPVQTLEPKLFEKTKNIIVIDHHRRIDNLLTEVALNYVEPYASSSVELVTEMLDLYSREIDLDAFEATVMLAGMMIDTNNFTYRTGVRTFEAAAMLKRSGADPFKARLILRESLDDIKTKSNLVNAAQIVANRYAITALSPETKTDRVQLAKTADELLEIDNIVASFAVGNLGGDQIGISARSIDKFNVQVMMEQFGGGGHLNNAAAQIQGGNIADIVAKLETLLKTNIKEEQDMKIILVKDVKGRGRKGDVLEVANGYGNYLLTSKQAIEASTANLKSLEDERDRTEREAEAELENAKRLKAELEDKPIKLYVKAGESGKLFGAVNTKQIAEEYKRLYNLDLDKRKIMLEDNIHALGVYKVPVRLHKDVTAEINLQIIEEK
ncbi:MAG: 50S ribosomal protein L9 [Candidatus Izemoplasmatales bacterium]